jgi:uncharacterized protein (DUF2461 family)
MLDLLKKIPKKIPKNPKSLAKMIKQDKRWSIKLIKTSKIKKSN